MIAYVVRRLVGSLVVVLGVSLIVFGFLHLSGDPVLLLVPSDATPETIASVRHALGFDRLLYEQYLRYLGGVLRGDLGTSLRMNQPALDLVLQRLPATFELSLAALLITIVVAVPAGVVSAVLRGSVWDHLAMLAAMFGQAVPVFWLGLILMLVFAVHLAWFPVFGAGGLEHLVLPAVTLSAVLLGRTARLVRSSMLEVLGRDYVRTARAKGLGSGTVLARHALRNALIPIVTLLGLQFAQLLGGAVVTETIFAWPGVGRLVVEAIGYRDFPLVQAVVLVVSLVFVLTNLLVDLSYTLLDPRIRVASDG